MSAPSTSPAPVSGGTVPPSPVDSNVAPVYEEVPTRVWCKYPGCGKSYASNDGVRKHAKRYHPVWLSQMDTTKEPVSTAVPPEGWKEEDDPAPKRQRRTEDAASAPHTEAGGAQAGSDGTTAAALLPSHASRKPSVAEDPNPRNPRNPVVPVGLDLPVDGAAGSALEAAAAGASEAADGAELGFWNHQMPPIKRGPSLLNSIEDEFEGRVSWEPPLGGATGGVPLPPGLPASASGGQVPPRPGAGTANHLAHHAAGHPAGRGPPALQMNPSEANLYINVLDQAELFAAAEPPLRSDAEQAGIQHTVTAGRVPSDVDLEAFAPGRGAASGARARGQGGEHRAQV